MTQAYQQDEADDVALGSWHGEELPAELARRESRLATIEATMRRLQEQVKREAAKVQSPEGRALYARHKVIVEPVFGQIKKGRGVRRFLLRGMEKLRGEWRSC